MYRVESIALREKSDGTKESELTVMNREVEVEEEEGQSEDSLLANVELQDGESMGTENESGDAKLDVEGNTIMIDVKSEDIARRNLDDKMETQTTTSYHPLLLLNQTFQ